MALLGCYVGHYKGKKSSLRSDHYKVLYAPGKVFVRVISVLWIFFFQTELQIFKVDGEGRGALYHCQISMSEQSDFK